MDAYQHCYNAHIKLYVYISYEDGYLLNSFRAAHSAPLWVLFGNIDLAEESGFYKKQRAACGSRCLTQLRALRLCISPTLLGESSLQSAGNISPGILHIKVRLSIWMLCVFAVLHLCLLRAKYALKYLKNAINPSDCAPGTISCRFDCYVSPSLKI